MRNFGFANLQMQRKVVIIQFTKNNWVANYSEILCYIGLQYFKK